MININVTFSHMETNHLHMCILHITGPFIYLFLFYLFPSLSHSLPLLWKILSQTLSIAQTNKQTQAHADTDRHKFIETKKNCHILFSKLMCLRSLSNKFKYTKKNNHHPKYTGKVFITLFLLYE